ncbi:MAG: hypothetical protein FWE34_06465 [Defluviitaleaceae bacterium]|nr:hypothetical protein [Defluviitaleaceae bacterium]
MAEVIFVDGVEVNVTNEEKYIFVKGLTANTTEGVWGFITQNYSGYEVDFSFNNVDAPPIDFFIKIGARLLEESTQLTLLSENFLEQPMPEGIIKITNANFEDFAQIHDAEQTDMYWTGDRLRQDLENWEIYAIYENSKISDYIVFSPPRESIFAAYGKNPENKVALLSAVANTSFTKSDAPIYFYTESHELAEQEAALKLGFEQAGQLVVYQVKVE